MIRWLFAADSFIEDENAAARCVRDSSENPFFVGRRKKRLQRIARPLAAPAWGTP